MKEYAFVLSFAIPFFILLMIIEFTASKIKGIEVYRPFDTITSISSGITNVVKDILGLIVVIVSYQWMYKNLALFSLSSSVLMYVLAFISLDFAGYWSHRFEHTVNIFWNRHIIHHSSEEYNLACALRQNFSALFAVFTFLLLPAAILGVPPEIINIVAPLHLFAQFWYHTRLIGKMGILESFIVTPSHHRVHHAINEIYLDKNYGQVFILWDKWFGTFQQELEQEPPVYGVKRPVATWNALEINFQHFWLLLKDAFYTKSWKDKCRIWFMPTGWRPEDVAQTNAITVVSNPFELNKYNHTTSFWSSYWMWFQLLFSLLLLFHFFSQIGDVPYPYLLVYGFFILVNIFSFNALMDGHWASLIGECIKFFIILGIWMNFGNWFQLPIYWIIAWQLVSLAITVAVIKEERAGLALN
ncbi:MAG TPA: sterol desaturase family protein [Saprospiraceae bacterium]|nr:sterol desaturase family protein [Saprospiraceae bacterium]HRG66010.1 sterol desaturase family protein [Saprospiraceae bacterium]